MEKFGGDRRKAETQALPRLWIKNGYTQLEKELQRLEVSILYYWGNDR